MALSILDGNQSATTLSTILSSGQHITAHTVVSLGTQAITDIVNATSTGLTNTQLRASAVTVGGTVTVGNSVTISSLPAISGTVTANLSLVGGFPNAVQLVSYNDDDLAYYAVAANTPDGPYIPTRIVGGTVTIGSALPAGTNRIGVVTIGAGTVTIGAGTAQIGSVTASISGTVPISISSVTVGNSVTIGSLPALAAGTNQIGSVTASISANPSGALTTRFGSVTTANTAQITTAVTNTSRKYLFAQNISIGSVTMGIGFSPTTTQGIQLSAGSGIVFDSFCPTGAVYWLGATTGAAWSILEG